jgi:hypothetical protein
VALRTRVKEIHQYLSDLCQLEIDRRIDEILSSPRYQDPRRLGKYEHRSFSQSGEDGIIREIFHRIGVEYKFFVECAPGDGLENNTTSLLVAGWKGVWIEGDRKHADAISHRFARRLKQHQLTFLHRFITAENIEIFLGEADVPTDFDLLSIDLDCNDYWVWKQVERYRPRVVVVEYNAIFPPGHDWVVEYAATAAWDGTSNSGASLTALELLGANKGYRLVGCNLAGTNAFFVDERLVQDFFSAPFTAENHYEPPRYYLISRQAGHRRSIS